MLFWLSDDRPHSSSDPFGATFPPGEGFGGCLRIWSGCSAIGGGALRYLLGKSILLNTISPCRWGFGLHKPAGGMHFLVNM